MTTHRLLLTAIAACAVLTLGLATVCAQPPDAGGQTSGTQGRRGGGGRMGGGRVMREAQNLPNLTDEQKKKLDDIQQRMRGEFEKMRGQAGQTSGTQAGGPPQFDRQAMQDMAKKFSEEIMGILTPEQKTELEAKLKEAPQGGPWQGGPGGPGGPGRDAPTSAPAAAK